VSTKLTGLLVCLENNSCEVATALIESNEQIVERADAENETCEPMVAARFVDDLEAGYEGTKQMEVERRTVVRAMVHTVSVVSNTAERPV
jgi:hypothetical protein